MTFKAKSAISIATPVLKLGGQYVKSVDQYKYLGILLDTHTELSDIKDIDLRENCDINIVQQTSCEPLFPVALMQLKTYFFVPFVRPCMHLKYGVISRSHACRDCVWHILLVAELYTTCPGKRVLVATKFNVTFLPLTEALLRKYTYLFLERCRKSNKVWLRALMQSRLFVLVTIL